MKQPGIKTRAGILGRLSHKQFLERYWQKRPLLIKGGFDPFPDVITPDELAGMCCDQRVESRLIMEKGGKHPWELRRGPFKPSIFKKLPKDHWTVLVNGVDRFVPGVHRLLDSFSFIPFWRMDDIMISYGVDQGNVGAHVDNFDVFLAQAAGKREWMIEDRPRVADDYIPGLPVRLLKDFEPTNSWVLEPGDILYLPPRFPHHGVARGDDCMTVSVGFRAPTISDIIQSVASKALSELSETARYSDPDLASQPAGEISLRSIGKVKKIVEDVMCREDFLASWMGTYFTEPYDDVELIESKRLSVDRIRQAVGRARYVVRSEGARLGYIRDKRSSLRFFVNGQEHHLSGAGARLAAVLADQVVADGTTVSKILTDAAAAHLMADLVAAGVVVLER